MLCVYLHVNVLVSYNLTLDAHSEYYEQLL